MDRGDSDGDRPFERRLASLDAAALRSFVADVWRARGRTVTDRSGGLLRVDGPDGSRRIAVVPAGGDVAVDALPDADAVVIADADADADVDALPDVDATVHGPAALRRHLRYAVDRADARAICDRHLDGAAPEPDGRPAGRPAGLDAGGERAAGSVEEGGGRGPTSEGAASTVAFGGPGADAARDGRERAGDDADPGDDRDIDERDEGDETDEGDDGGTEAEAADPSVAGVALDRRLLGVVAVGVVVLAALAGGFVPVGVAGPGGGPAAADARDGTSTPADPYAARATGAGVSGNAPPPQELEIRAAAAAADPPAADRPAGSTVAAGGEAAARLPPGVAPDGTVDEVVLAEATRRALTDASYRVTLTRRERVAGDPVGQRREVVEVATATRFVSRVEQYGTVSTSNGLVAERSSYVADGRRVTRTREGDGGTEPTTARALGGTTGATAPVVDRLARLVDWYLSVDESRIAHVTERDGRRFYTLALDGDPYPGVANVTGTAVVDDRGLVREVRRTYSPPDRPEVRATVHVVVSDLNRTTVEPPAWYEARNASAPGGDADGSGTSTPAATPTPTPTGTGTATPTPTGTGTETPSFGEP